MTLPFKYQLQDVRTIHQMGGRVLLAHEPGLGKTLMALMHAMRHKELRPIVVVCPAYLKWNWERETKKHFRLIARVLEGYRAPRSKIAGRFDILIVNYEILQSKSTPHGKLTGWKKYIKEKIKPKLIIIDECVYVKSRSAGRTRAVRSICDNVPSLLALGGTGGMENRPAELFPTLNILRPDLFPRWLEFGFKFCLPHDAPVLMGDFTEKPISEINIGDSVIGWSKSGSHKNRRLVSSKVLDIIKRRDCPLQKVTLENGVQVVCTPDHLWATGGCANTSYEYLPATLGSLKSKKGGSGYASKIMQVFRGTSPIFPENEDYMLGYIHGFWRGDGHCTKTRSLKINFFKSTERWMKTRYAVGCACNDEEPISRIDLYLTKLGINHYKHQRSDGMYEIRGLSNKRGFSWVSQNTTRESNEWWAGFLGGIYDAEGSGRTIGQRKHINPITFELIGIALNKFGFSHRSNDESYWMHGSRAGLLQFWNVANPSLRRKLSKFILNAGGRFAPKGACKGKSPRVVSIEGIPGLHNTFTLTTETGNYVAYGCGSKNCGPRKNPFGGWDFKGATNTKELHQILTKNLMIRRRKIDVLSQLPKKRRIVTVLDIVNRSEYDEAVESFVSWVRKTHGASKAEKASRVEGLSKLGYLLRLTAKLKMRSVESWLDDWLEESESKIIVFAIHHKVVHHLHERYKDRAVWVTGEVTGKKRHAIFQSFLNDKRNRMLIGNIQAVGMGLSALGVSTTAFVELAWSPGAHNQAEDRVHGIGRGVEGQKTESFYLLAKGTIEETVCRLLQRKATVLAKILDGGRRQEDIDIYTQLTRELLKEKI